MVSHHTASSSDVWWSRMVYMVAHHTASSSGVWWSRMVYTVALTQLVALMSGGLGWCIWWPLTLPASVHISV